LAGRIGLSDVGDKDQLRRVGDGRGIMFTSLEGFPYNKFGIDIS